MVLAIVRDVTERTRLRQQSEQQLRDLRGLYQADEVLHRSLRLGDVLRGLVDLVIDMLGADQSTVLTWDARHERLVPAAVGGFQADSLVALSTEPGDGIVGRVVAERQTIAIGNTAHVPVQIGGDVFGVFSVHYRTPHPFTDAELRLLDALAQRAALAIENAQLYERAQHVAALEERQRLARDLHDAVTQTLFAASLIAETLPSVWRRDPDVGERSLQDLRRLTWGALAEMRTLLLELRPAALTESTLSRLLEQLGDGIAAPADLEVRVTTLGDAPLPEDVQIAAYRLTQEALNNIVKHAAARRADVDLRVTARSLELTIVDDGRGFDVESVPAGHLGIGIMRERAEGIGANLAIESRPGAGTRISLTWPADQDRDSSD